MSNPGRVDLFHRGTDSCFYHKAWNGTNLNTNWASIGGSFIFEPVTLLWGPDLVYVFGVNFDSAIQYKSYHKLTGKWTENWIELKGLRAPAVERAATNEPDQIRWAAKPAIVSLYPKSMEIVGLASDHMLYHGCWRTGAGWSRFSPLPDQYFQESPSLVTQGFGRFDVFALGLDGNIYHRWWMEEKGWLPGISRGDSRSPSVASSLDPEWVDDTDEPEKPARGRETQREKSNPLRQVTSTWENIGGPFAHTPSAVSWAKGRIDLIGIAGGGKVYHTFWDENGEGWPAKWKDVGMTSAPVGRPDVVSWGPNRLDIFVIGGDRAIHHKWLDASEGYAWKPSGEDESLGSKASGDYPTAASMGPENLVVLHIGGWAGVRVRSWNPKDGWSRHKNDEDSFSPIGAVTLSRISACAAQDAMFNP